MQFTQFSVRICRLGEKLKRTNRLEEKLSRTRRLNETRLVKRNSPRETDRYNLVIRNGFTSRIDSHTSGEPLAQK